MAGGGARGAAVVALVPGNGGGGCVRGCNFYGAAEAALSGGARARGGRALEVRLPEGGMPDPLRAREAVWVPFIRDELLPDRGGGRPAVLVGHSSGAAAALRVAEARPLAGLVLVAAYDDDLGDELEAASGYFSRPFDWARIRRNCGFIAQFGGRRDTLVPVAVQRRVAAALRLEEAEWAGGPGASFPQYAYAEDPEGDHFFAPPSPLVSELAKVIEQGLARGAQGGAAEGGGGGGA